VRLPRPTLTSVRYLAIASVVVNIAIIVTGGAVRLTGSGLGCPTWPRCTEDSFVSHPALGIHGAIEFGNRLITFVVAAVVGLAWLAALRARPRRRDLVGLATILLAGVPLQAVAGGITVLTDLNPWWVSVHFLLSPALVAVAVVFVRRCGEAAGPTRPTVPRSVRQLAYATFAAAAVVVYVGTLVTGSGPHAGDERAPRNGLDPESISQLHADVAFLLLGLTIGTLLAFRAVGAPDRARRATRWLLGIEIAQSVIGFTQYFTGLPTTLVGLHLLGSALMVVAATAMVLGTREPAPAGAVEPPGAERPALAQVP
jgi:cytochrome c oxidase assembly protein subunit 15